MKTIKEYLLESKVNLSDTEKKIKERIDWYFNIVLEETHYPKFEIKEDDDKMPEDLKQWFISFVRWMIYIIPSEYYEFVTTYYLRKQFVKSKVKLPQDDSVFNNLYNKWKVEIEEIFKKDTERKEEDRKECPEYYKNVKSIF